MLIARIAGATRTLGAPPDWDEERDGLCGGLPILDTMEGGQPVMISAWQPTPEELLALMAGASVYLKVVGRGHPPVMVWVETP